MSDLSITPKTKSKINYKRSEKTKRPSTDLDFEKSESKLENTQSILIDFLKDPIK
jgi:hypothetical protein